MRSLTAVTFVAIAASAAACRAQKTDSAALAAAIAPYVDGQTLAVAHADLAAFDAPGAVDVLARFLHLGQRDRDRAQARVVPLNVLAGSLPPGTRADGLSSSAFPTSRGCRCFSCCPPKARRRPARSRWSCAATSPPT